VFYFTCNQGGYMRNTTLKLFQNNYISHVTTALISV